MCCFHLHVNKGGMNANSEPTCTPNVIAVGVQNTQNYIPDNTKLKVRTIQNYCSSVPVGTENVMWGLSVPTPVWLRRLVHVYEGSGALMRVAYNVRMQNEMTWNISKNLLWTFGLNREQGTVQNFSTWFFSLLRNTSYNLRRTCSVFCVLFLIGLIFYWYLTTKIDVWTETHKSLLLRNLRFLLPLSLVVHMVTAVC
jgi:hypothetical protein